jgi:16S rRNA G1207 methylase RsmC
MDLREMPDAPFRRHPWEVARARFFAQVLSDAGWLDAPRAVLDVGAGDGFLARQLLERLPAGSRVVCFDSEYRSSSCSTSSSTSATIAASFAACATTTWPQMGRCC